jgi:hypothetical protein
MESDHAREVFEELLEKEEKPRDRESDHHAAARCLQISPTLYSRRKPRHDNRRLRLRYAQPGFAPAPAALLPLECGKPKPEARNLGVDEHFRRRKWAHLMGK